MRFIVDLYKLIIYASIGILIISVIYAIALAMKMGANSVLFTGFYLIGSIGLFLTVVLALGVLATFISIHDRHADIADELRAIRIALSHQEGQS